MAAITTHIFTPRERACPACQHTVTSVSQHGVDCGNCGHHFHIGATLIIGIEPIRCPRCEAGTLPLDMGEAL